MIVTQYSITVTGWHKCSGHTAQAKHAISLFSASIHKYQWFSLAFVLYYIVLIW